MVHHFDFEAARGVEELSPLKAAGGLSLEALHSNSPAQRTPDISCSCAGTHPGLHAPVHIAGARHGRCTTVPFTATAEAARRLVACGLAPQQLYLAKTGHQETVLHMMLGGLTYDKVVAWLASRPSSARASAVVGMKSRL